MQDTGSQNQSQNLPGALPPLPQATPAPGSTMPQPDTNWPTKKKNNKLKYFLGGFLALLIVGGVSFGAYYFTKNLNRADVPNAPSSQPQAAWVTNKASGKLVNTKLVNVIGGEVVSKTKLGEELGIKLNGNGTIINTSSSDTGSGTNSTAANGSCTVSSATNLKVENISTNSAKLTWTPGVGGYVKLWVSSAAGSPTIDCGRLPNKTVDNVCVANENGSLIDGDSNHADIPSSTTSWIVNNLKPNTTYNWRMMMWVVSGCDSASPITTFKTTEIACTSGLESTAKTTACTSDGVTNGVMSLGFVCKNQTTKDLNTITRTTCTDLESLKSQAEIVCKQKYPCTGETACVDSTWTPDKSTVCSGKTYLQKSNCGIEKEATGTKTDGACLTCNNETWSPAVDTICKGVEFTQKSSCDASKTRTSTGTKTDGSCSTNTTNGAVDLTIEKRAYEDVSNNSAGDYDMSYEIDKVAKDQVFVYAFEITNDGDATASAIKVVDVLKGDNRELLSFVDGDGDCGYVNSTRTVTCQGMSLKPGESKVYAFRVKVANSAINGDTISNTGTITYKDMPSGGETESNNELTISTVVGCNHVCTSDDECSTGLICDTDTSKCRKATCTEATACNCTVQKTSTETTPTKKITVAATKPQPTELPETGILDFPGVATFGGGLLLAVIGILLAL